jgi:hypothetical protein
MKPFSVSIAWRNRPELAKTLEANAPFFEQHCEEVTIVNCGGDPDEVSRLARGVRIPGLRQVHVPDVPFNKTLANNIGGLCSSRPFIFFLDADIILESDPFARALPLLERGDCVVMIRTVLESKPQPRAVLRSVKEIIKTTKFVFRNGRTAYIRAFVGGDGSRSGLGLILVRRTHLTTVGGFNSALTGWGFDDTDLIFRLEFVLGLRLRAVGRVLHLTHGDEHRDILNGSTAKDYQHNLWTCSENYNRDQLMGTWERDDETLRDKIRVIPIGEVAHANA